MLLVACKNWDLGKRDPPPRDFLAELHVYRLLHHENLLMFIGGACEPGNAFLLTEFAAGGSLDGFLGKQVRLPNKESISSNHNVVGQRGP